MNAVAHAAPTELLGIPAGVYRHAAPLALVQDSAPLP
jgi:hypothetical protein